MNRLRELRKRNGFSLKYVANFISVSEGMILLLENGKRHLTVKYAIQFADLYGVSIDYLAGREFSGLCYHSQNQTIM